MITAGGEERPCTEMFRLQSANGTLNNALEQIPSLLSFCQLNTGKEYVAGEIYAAASERIGLLIPFKVSAFFEMAGPGADLEVCHADCGWHDISLFLEMERLVEDKVLDWALRRRLPVILASEEKGENLILHALVSATGVRGLFVAVLACKVEQIADCDLSLLSILLSTLANSIELFELEDAGRRKSMTQENNGEPGRNGQDAAITTNTSSINRNMSFDSKTIINEKINYVLQLTHSLNELKNPINFIRVNLEFLKKYLSDVGSFIDHFSSVESGGNTPVYDLSRKNETNGKKTRLFDISTRDDLSSIFAESHDGLGRIDDLISSVGRFYKICEQDVPVIVNINNLVEETLTFTEKLFQKEVKFVTDFATVPSVLGYPLLLKDVFLSLFQRGIVAFENQRRSTPGCIVIKTWVDKQKIWCTVNDDRPGLIIDDRRFDGNTSRHLSTDHWHLSNVGLAIVHDVVVNKHKGDIRVACGEGGGSMITIQLPVWDCDDECAGFSLV